MQFKNTVICRGALGETLQDIPRLCFAIQDSSSGSKLRLRLSFSSVIQTKVLNPSGNLFTYCRTNNQFSTM